MKSALIKMYFKGGVLVPFYVSCFLTLMFFFAIADHYDFNLQEIKNSYALYEILKVPLFSGLTGLCSLTIFLNAYRTIAENFWYSLLSFVLLPYAFIAFVLIVVVDWRLPILAAQYCVIFFLHFIGPIISFQSFRATVLLNKNDKQIMNIENNVLSSNNNP